MKNLKAIIFDAYGTLFDVNSAAAKCREKLGSKWEGFANSWRTTQLEYTWLRSLMKKHKNFWEITEDSLDHTMETFKIKKEMRNELLDVLNQDYIRTARSKGISKYRIVLRHSLRNAMIPPVTLLGIQFGLLITGAVITEEVFARPGLGQLLLQAILAKDIPLVQALVVYMTAVYIFLNLIVDFTYGIIDPRIRLERNRG